MPQAFSLLIRTLYPTFIARSDCCLPGIFFLDFSAVRMVVFLSEYATAKRDTGFGKAQCTTLAILSLSLRHSSIV